MTTKSDNTKFSKKIEEITHLILQNNTKNNISLMGGITGDALFLFYQSQSSLNEEVYDKACQLIENAFDEIQNGFGYETFAGGLAGLGWLLEHLSQNDILEIDTNETIGELDDYLYHYMLREIKQGNYDYLHNAGGIALYFLSRNSNPKSKEYLKEYVDELAKHSISENNEIKWISEIIVKDDEKAKVYNISLSHGIASIIVVLSKIYKKGINKEKTGKLLQGAINYLLANQFNQEQSLSCFPNSISLDGDKGHPSRLAWCYGDLGISVALWNASQSLNDEKLERKAIEILTHASKRKDLHENFVVDAGLCHGTAGIAYIFHRMFINTNNPDFKEVSEYWFDETLKMAKFEEGLAGYKAYRTEELGGWVNEYGFLEGIAGIGLALLSKISDIPPAWDECLLLS